MNFNGRNSDIGNLEHTTKQTITCLKLSIKTVEQNVKYGKS